VSSTDTGRQAEAAAATYLEMRGYKVLEQNWRRPKCEIDIVAKKDGAMYFIEVKYRRNDDQGGGLEALTASKVKQMRYAAQMWVEENEYPGEYSLGAIELSGPKFAVLSFLDNVY
jgi:putative endonuclease